MTFKFKRIGILGRPYDYNANTVSLINNICECLINQQIDTLIDQDTAQLINTAGFKLTPKIAVATRHEIGKECDLAIVIGGDGSMLNAARTLADYDISVIGIHRGRLGFLTDINPNNIDAELNKILAGSYIKTEIYIVHADIIQDGVVRQRVSAVNEVVINSGNITRMIEFEVYINEQFVYQQRSDGLIIATPTGSTAYALSGGGPIVNPELKALTLVPMFPHNLTSRPIVISDTSKIKIIPVISDNLIPSVSGDGQPIELLKHGDIIQVYKSDKVLHLLHPSDYNYYETLRTKLHWGTKPV